MSVQPYLALIEFFDNGLKSSPTPGLSFTPTRVIFASFSANDIPVIVLLLIIFFFCDKCSQSLL